MMRNLMIGLLIVLIGMSGVFCSDSNDSSQNDLDSDMFALNLPPALTGSNAGGGGASGEMDVDSADEVADHYNNFAREICFLLNRYLKI